MKMGVPYNYEALNLIYGHISPNETNYNAAVTRFWIRSLFDRMISTINFEVPDNWRGDVYSFFKIVLFCRGFLVISRNDELGYWFQPCGLTGRDFYYQPTGAIVSNPSLKKSLRLKLHEDGELLRLTPDFRGTIDIVHRYAEELAQMSSALDIAIHNSKWSFILAGRNRAAVSALEKIIDNVNKGRPAVFIDKALLNDRTDKDGPFQLVQPVVNVKENYIVDALARDIQTMISNFDAEIGIQTVPYQKAERMTDFESRSKGNDSKARLAVWTECLDSSIEQIKELYPDIKLGYTIREEVLEDGEREADPAGSDELGSDDL